jgi:uncharacterized membrane protein YdjX (TVP38/TMEM64 family)
VKGIKTYFRIGVLIAIGIGIVLLLRSEFAALLRQGDLEALQLFMEENLLFMLSLTFLAMMIQNAITLFPLVLLTTLNATLFGFFYGYVWSWITSVVAATVVFLIARYAFQDWLPRVSEQVKKKIEDRGFLFVFLARIFPFFPTSVINLTAGLTTIRFKCYLIATIIGNMIYIFALTLIPLGLLSLDLEQIILVVVCILILVIAYYVKKNKLSFFSKQKKDEATVDK